ncbi:MAG TPA: cyclase family protein [Elusimicrobiota bacterium]|nr:cyclase family protein [Elusimicrobiota bacterium]
MPHGLPALRDIALVDLSVPISASTAEPEPPRIDYVDHRRSAAELARAANALARTAARPAAAERRVEPSSFRDGLGLANENLILDTHAGTHLDAPWHFGPECENKPARTIDRVPLEWCLAPGVVLDLRFKKAGETISPADLQAALERIAYRLRPGDIVLLMTGADKHFDQQDYFVAHAGMGREATLWLLDQGIKIIGIDGWGFDRHAHAMLDDFFAGHPDALFPAHMVGREREYCHIEKMANLDRIPVPYGFWVACFPVKVERGSAGWVRAVAMINKEDCHDRARTQH